MGSGLRRLSLLGLGWLCVGLGMAGVFLPVLPTTPFLLVAAWAFSTTSRRFHDWLVGHPRLGPPVRAWRQHRVISPRAKVLAVTSMGASLAYVTLFVADGWLLPLIAATPMGATAAWVLTRPGRLPE